MDKYAKIFPGKSAFVGYITSGDGGINYCIEAALALEEGGVDILELGMPFSDPIADGPVIQAASRRALQSGATLDTPLRIAEGIRRRSKMPLIFFSYFNPIMQGGKGFLTKLRESGFDAVLLVDLPLEEALEYHQAVNEADLGNILIAAPSTPMERIREIAEKSQGFIYYACQKGTTGVRKNLPQDLGGKIQSIKSCTQTPVVAGFGISSRDTAEEALKYADGFVVGSAFVSAIAKGARPKQLQTIAQQIDPRG